MKSILENEVFSIAHDAAQAMVVMRRKNIKISAVNWDRIMMEVMAALQPLRGQRLLLDVRLAPGNNDPSIEQKVNTFRRRLSALFPVSATVIATAVGRLQVARMSRERGEAANNIFSDEPAAVAYLLEQDIAVPQH